MKSDLILDLWGLPGSERGFWGGVCQVGTAQGRTLRSISANGGTVYWPVYTASTGETFGKLPKSRLPYRNFIS